MWISPEPVSQIAVVDINEKPFSCHPYKLLLFLEIFEGGMNVALRGRESNRKESTYTVEK